MAERNSMEFSINGIDPVSTIKMSHITIRIYICIYIFLKISNV